MKILVINGPNMNLLGTREPEIYGNTTLEEVNCELIDFSKKVGEDVELSFFQSNHEGEIVDKIQSAKDEYNGIIINPAGYTHTSVAIADAIKGINIPSVEVHLSNINSREDFRKNSFIAQNCVGQITGFKKDSYKLALIGLYNYLKEC